MHTDDLLMDLFHTSNAVVRPRRLQRSAKATGDAQSEAIYLGPTPPTSPEEDVFPQTKAARSLASSGAMENQVSLRTTGAMNPCAAAFTPADSPLLTVLAMSQGSRSSSGNSVERSKSTKNESVPGSQSATLCSPRPKNGVFTGEFCLRK